METGLRNKRVVITGATAGIGRGIAHCFAREGAQLAICARNEAPLQQVRQECVELGGQTTALLADMTRADDIDRFVAASREALGGIDVLVNCVGGVDQLLPFEALSDDDWQQMWELNVMSAVRMTRAVLPIMKPNGWGRIINIASESGIQPDPFMPHYNAAKAALITFTKSMSKALADDGILVNAVSPAMTRNDDVDAFISQRAAADGSSLKEAEQTLLREMRPNIVLGRPGEPEEVGAAVVFLASEQASFITGTNLRADGGSVASI
ncbi:MAG TPA: ketoacyl reductase [Gammaproteobacteria bacterium]|nr:ketoacyl reductase [Gammaproteobacteria bacterium]